MRPTSCRIIGEVQAAGHTSLTAIAGQPPGRLSDIWVHFGDLPDEVREPFGKEIKLRKRCLDGSGAEETGPVPEH
jgi:hypothetical protein